MGSGRPVGPGRTVRRCAAGIADLAATALLRRTDRWSPGWPAGWHGHLLRATYVLFVLSVVQGGALSDAVREAGGAVGALLVGSMLLSLVLVIR